MERNVLKRLLNRTESAAVIRRLLLSIGEPTVIEDGGGPILTVHEGVSGSSRYPVSASGATIGWVCGGTKVSPVAELLSYLAERELEKRALAGETLERYRDLSLFYEIADRIPAGTDSTGVSAAVIEEIRRLFKPDAASVMLFNAATGRLDIVSACGRLCEPAVSMGPGEGISGAVFIRGQAEMVDNVSSDHRYKKGGNSASSLLCTPLKTGEAVIGVVNVSRERPSAYKAADLKLLTGLAAHAASSLENARLYERLKDTFYTTLRTLAETIEKRDPFTSGHTKRVMEYSLAVGRIMELPAKDMHRLELAAMLHDIGAIGVRDSVLLKPARLDEAEFEEMKRHTIFGEEILAPIEQLKGAIPGVRHHHERFDGSGYPDGQAGDEIDITARIIGVTDSFDAMTSKRPYRLGLTMDHAFEELKRCSGTLYDPEVVDAFFAADVMEAFFTANARKKILPDL
jgi:HD-GYP domain-containing protein (c-di-GMP phosphodiesterase class II)